MRIDWSAPRRRRFKRAALSTEVGRAWRAVSPVVRVSGLLVEYGTSVIVQNVETAGCTDTQHHASRNILYILSERRMFWPSWQLYEPFNSNATSEAVVANQGNTRSSTFHMSCAGWLLCRLLSDRLTDRSVNHIRFIDCQ